jgi:hypothetical protein
MWAWASFAIGYTLGGLSGVLVLGFFMVGGRGETAEETPIPARPSMADTVVKFDPAQAQRKAQLAHQSETPPDRPA